METENDCAPRAETGCLREIFTILSLTAFLVAPGVALAQPPNDSCVGAIPIALDTVYTLNTASATSTGDPTNVCGAPFGAGVWYTFTAPTNGMLTLSTCGSDFDTIFQVYTGICDSLTPVICADDNGPACAGAQASASFLVSGGVTYYIVVGGSGGATGNLQLLATMPPPANDQCSGAIPLTEGVPYTENTANATVIGDPTPPCQPDFGAGVWFQYTATSTGPLSISTGGSDLYTALEVFTGTCGSLVPVLCNSTDGPGPGGARATAQFQGTSGVTYLILVGGYYGTLKSGNIQILAEEGVPANDVCSGAISTVAGNTYTMNTTSATNDSSWYTFTPSSNAIVTVSTCPSDFETVLQVYTGSCGSLTAVTDGNSAGNTFVCGTNRANVSFAGTAGITYYVQVTGLNGEAGNLSIQPTLSAPLSNDTCSGATSISPGVTYNENTATATSGGDPSPGGAAGKGVWFSYIVPSNCIVSLSTCESDFSTVLQVYTGICGSMTPVTDGFDINNGPSCGTNRASVAFLASAGTKYYIYVGGNNYAVGNLSLEMSLEPQLPNDQCSGAIALSDGVVNSLNTSTATSTGDPISSCIDTPDKAVWYTYTMLATDDVIINTAGSDFQTIVQVYQGTCGSLTPVVCGSSSVRFTGAAGQTYYIAVGGVPSSGATGHLQIVAAGVLPSNDQYTNPIPIELGSNYVENTTYATSSNDPAPTCGGSLTKSVWYEYTPPLATQLTISTCGSDFETGLQVFTSDGSTLVPVACNDGTGSPCGNQAIVTFAAAAGTNYLIEVGGRDGQFGNLSLLLSAPPPSNDTCASPLPISEGVTYTENTTYATTNGDPPAVSNAVWFSYTPSREGMLLLSTCGSDFDTGFQVYTGTCGSLTNVLYADNNGPACTGVQASAEFLVSPGTTYLIAAGGGMHGGSGNLNLLATMPVPTNDQCSGAVTMTSGVTYTLYTVNASETNDPLPLCQTNFGKGVWYTYTPQVNGTARISTCASDFDTVLQVYTGVCGALTPLANSCDDDAGPECGGFQASVRFEGVAGTTYWILVGGYGGAFGNLAIEAEAPPTVNFSQRGTNLVLAWPTNAGGFALEATTNLTPPVVWTNVIGQSISGTNYVFTNSISAPATFYRLEN